MKKIIILSFFVCFAFSVSAQSSVKSAIKNNHKAIAKEYVQQNPTDAKAATLVNGKINPEYIAYFSKVSPKYNAFVKENRAKAKVRANRN